MLQLEAEQIAEGVVKHDAHAREYYRLVVQEWLNSPFVSGETPQMWLKKQHKIKPPKPPKPPRQKKVRPRKPRKGSSVPAPASNGSTFVYVLKTKGNTEFTGFGFTTAPRIRYNNHKHHLKNAGSVISSVEWFEMDFKGAKIIEEAIKQTFPLTFQPVKGFRTEATGIDLYQDVLDFVTLSSAQRKHLANVMKSI